MTQYVAEGSPVDSNEEYTPQPRLSIGGMIILEYFLFCQYALLCGEIADVSTEIYGLRSIIVLLWRSIAFSSF